MSDRFGAKRPRRDPNKPLTGSDYIAGAVILLFGYAIPTFFFVAAWPDVSVSAVLWQALAWGGAALGFVFWCLRRFSTHKKK
ncbi:MAG: hypothetical protein AAGF92_17040 [Myxococcota bacterium]